MEIFLNTGVGSKKSDLAESNDRLTECCFSTMKHYNPLLYQLS
jgi:hypothetical protein